MAVTFDSFRSARIAPIVALIRKQRTRLPGPRILQRAHEKDEGGRPRSTKGRTYATSISACAELRNPNLGIRNEEKGNEDQKCFSRALAAEFRRQPSPASASVL
jgi:hypothetical protein